MIEKRDKIVETKLKSVLYRYIPPTPRLQNLQNREREREKKGGKSKKLRQTFYEAVIQVEILKSTPRSYEEGEGESKKKIKKRRRRRKEKIEGQKLKIVELSRRE